jgi:membrane associated rhomboid family serine protease
LSAFQSGMFHSLEQGDKFLAAGQLVEAGKLFQESVQEDSNNAGAWLGMAKFSIGSGSYEGVVGCCHRVQALQTGGGRESALAQILLATANRDYERALPDLDTYILYDVDNAYAYALQAYLQHMTGHEREAEQAHRRAYELSKGGYFQNCFRELKPEQQEGAPPEDVAPAYQFPSQANEAQAASQPQLQFAGRSRSRIVTSVILAIILVIYVITAIQSRSLVIDINVLYAWGGQVNGVISQGEYWRLFAAIFLHADLAHVMLNALSLFFIGSAIEIFYGKWRYILIYLAAGLAGSVLTYFTLPPDQISIGASGAVFGLFGALGSFYLVNRRALGPAFRGLIQQWVFWLGLNLVFGLASASINSMAHLGGLGMGLVLGFLLAGRLRVRQSPPDQPQ